MKTVLVTGGAGFVGSQTVLHLREHGYRVVVIDNLSTGHREFAAHADRFVEGRFEDVELTEAVFRSEPIDGVVHCAALALVEESTREPLMYFQANAGALGVFLEVLVRHGLPPIVFSSSATVYGAPSAMPVDESTPTLPINPYGESKLAAERLIKACGDTYGLRSLVLRYFNAAGADPERRVGEWHEPETHVIPNLLDAAEQRRPFEVRGTDWPTPDGSPVRDFIHTLDLARVHRMGLEYLWDGGQSEELNIGSGKGASVLELVRVVSRVTQAEIDVRVSPRRPGDAPSLWARIDRARELLGFEPKHSDLEHIVRDAAGWRAVAASRLSNVCY